MIEEYRNKFELRQVSYCYITDLDGEKGIPKLEEDEILDGFETVWMSMDEAIETIKNESTEKGYTRRFIKVRDLCILEEAKKYLTNNLN